MTKTELGSKLEGDETSRGRRVHSARHLVMNACVLTRTGSRTIAFYLRVENKKESIQIHRFNSRPMSFTVALKLIKKELDAADSKLKDCQSH